MVRLLSSRGRPLDPLRRTRHGVPELDGLPVVRLPDEAPPRGGGEAGPGLGGADRVRGMVRVLSVGLLSMPGCIA